MCRPSCPASSGEEHWLSSSVSWDREALQTRRQVPSEDESNGDAREETDHDRRNEEERERESGCRRAKKEKNLFFFQIFQIFAFGRNRKQFKWRDTNPQKGKEEASLCAATGKRSEPRLAAMEAAEKRRRPKSVSFMNSPSRVSLNNSNSLVAWV